MHADDHRDRPWTAPAAAGPIDARVRLPASKSITNRALVLAALSEDPAMIVNPLRARDTVLATGALRTMGAQIAETTELAEITDPSSRTAWRVTAGSPPAGSGVSVDVGNAGTVMRFLPAVAALTSASVHFDGDARARERPVGPILAALRRLGADIDDGGRSAIPFTVHGHGAVRGGAVTLDASGSSQLVSGLLLAAPRFAQGIEIRHSGPPVPSAPHIAMTVRMLRAAGADVAESSGSGSGSGGSGSGSGSGGSGSGSGAGGFGGRPDAWRVRPGRLNLGTITVEPDLSNAGPFLAAALVTAGTVTVPDWPRDSLQAAGPILDVLTAMGARCEVGADGLRITGTGRIRGIHADLRDVNELAPVLTAVAAMADSPSAFTGLAHTRTHETDRLAAMAKEINALGGDITEQPDGLQIRPRPLRAPADSEPFDSYDDHRMVMAAAVLGLVVPGLRVANAQTVAKTFPGFTDVWAGMLGAGP
ncbi:MAG: 3-phosphoshikimate 1-carboxyvinyltransferase [Streptosporangiaceae bacterium]|jgi:3-phosphoshikimate 1-carboxyvinyltransferase